MINTKCLDGKKLFNAVIVAANLYRAVQSYVAQPESSGVNCDMQAPVMHDMLHLSRGLKMRCMQSKGAMIQVLKLSVMTARPEKTLEWAMVSPSREKLGGPGFSQPEPLGPFIDVQQGQSELKPGR